ncbi:hypothetical protein N2152v2_000331 [Parachlorella kessleri]
MDSSLLRRFWESRSAGGRGGSDAERKRAPSELADRCLIFYRGVDVARMEGSYLAMKIDYLITFFILAPIWGLVAKLLGLLRINLPEGAMAGVFPEKQAEQAQAPAAPGLGQQDGSTGAAGAEDHQYAVKVERRTFARVFPDGPAVLRQFTKKVKLQEACFRDVVVLYRKSKRGRAQAAGEFDIIHNIDPAIAARNIYLKHFQSIPLADLELVLPEKTVFVPPTTLLQLVVTAILGLVAVWTAFTQASEATGSLHVVAFRDKMSMTVIYSAVALLGSRAAQVYYSTQSARTLIEKKMSQMLYERTAASQEAVLQTLAEEMSKQRVRELFVCYCILLHANQPLAAPALDRKCEHFLARRFGLRIDFTAEQAIPALLGWGLVTQDGGGALQAVPLHSALERLDAIWDGLFDFSGHADTESVASGGGANKAQHAQHGAPHHAGLFASLKLPSLLAGKKRTKAVVGAVVGAPQRASQHAQRVMAGAKHTPPAGHARLSSEGVAAAAPPAGPAVMAPSAPAPAPAPASPAPAPTVAPQKELPETPGAVGGGGGSSISSSPAAGTAPLALAAAGASPAGPSPAGPSPPASGGGGSGTRSVDATSGVGAVGAVASLEPPSSPPGPALSAGSAAPTAQQVRSTPAASPQQGSPASPASVASSSAGASANGGAVEGKKKSKGVKSMFKKITHL